MTQIWLKAGGLSSCRLNSPEIKANYLNVGTGALTQNDLVLPQFSVLTRPLAGDSMPGLTRGSHVVMFAT